MLHFSIITQKLLSEQTFVKAKWKYLPIYLWLYHVVRTLPPRFLVAMREAAHHVGALALSLRACRAQFLSEATW